MIAIANRRPARYLAIFGATLTLVFSAEAQVIFSDNFDSGPSPLWGNQRGEWDASGGVYFAQHPNNAPPTYSLLPLNLTNFAIDVDISGVGDGGIWLRSASDVSTGVLLVTGGHGWGFPGHGTDPEAGRSLYWHSIGGPSGWLNEAHNVFTNPGVQSVHVRVEVMGNVYSAFLDGSKTPTTTLVDSTFASGLVGLYAYSSQTFDNFVVSVLVPPPSPPVASISPAVEVSWVSTTNGLYQVQWATSVDSTNWTNLGPPVQATGTNASAFDSTRFAEKRFYRILVLP